MARARLLQALVLTYSLTAGAFQSNPPSLVNEPVGLIRLAIAVAAGMLGLLVRDVAARRNGSSGHSIAIDVIVVYGLIFMTQQLVGFIRPELALPLWSPTQGGFVGFALFTATRALFARPVAANGGPVPESNTTTDERIKEAKSYRGGYIVAASVSLAVGLYWFFTGYLLVQIAGALMVIGSVHLQWRAFKHRAADGITSHEQLTPFCEMLRGASAWYYLALLPASMLILFGAKVYLYWIPLVILLFAEANQRAAVCLKSALGK